MNNLHRRDIFRIVGIALATERLSAHEHSTGDWSIPKEAPRFFSKTEYETIVDLCGLLLPSDDDSPGAVEAGVGWFMDTVLLYAEPARQKRWKSSVAMVNEFAENRYGMRLAACAGDHKVAVMQEISKNEGNPQTPLEWFFAEFKQTAIEGFCLSEVGMKQYLHYRGNTELTDFPGCEEASF